MKRRTLSTLLAGLAAATLLCQNPVAAQTNFPDKPIRLVLPYAPGGSVSALALYVAPLLSKALGQSVFVDHRPGGNTLIGTAFAAKAPADGYTLFLTASSHVVVPLMTNAPYDPFKDFIPVATLAKTEFVLVVNPAMPAKTLAEFISMAKANPGTVSYGSAGNGSGVHLVTELFAQTAGIKLQHVPYKGSGPAINDLVGGQLQSSFQTPAVAAPFVTSGRLRALVTTGNARQPSLPGVPTLSEAGMPSVAASNWFGILVPAGTPQEITARLSDAVSQVSQQVEFRDRLVTMGFDPHHVSGEEFLANMREESARMGKLVRSTKISMD